MKKCPFCAEEIEEDAIKCRYCGSILSAAGVYQPDAELQQRIQAGDRIAAIKTVREKTGLGLKEAKDYVEALERGESPTVPALAPGSGSPRKGSGCGTPVFLFAAVVVAILVVAWFVRPLRAQSPPSPDDAVRSLVSRLDLERYKATIKGLTQFGDRRQGTQRNRAAVDWIETQLRSYGCTNIARLKYDFQPPPRPAGPPPPANPLVAVGGGRPRGNRVRTGVNNDANAQPDARLRTLNAEPTTAGPREEVYCTKLGVTHPDEMYIIGAHMDGIGWGEGANDDGSGTALVMELARVFNAPDVRTERSIRFILWNNEESGLDGSRAYVSQRRDLRGREEPIGSGRYPEPRWLGVIQHDMMLFDHGMPRADGTMSPDQRPEADINIEFQSMSQRAPDSQALAWVFHRANEKYATEYPASVGPHMTNTDSTPFMDDVPAISMRENDRGTQIGSGWDPQWHQPTDVFATYSDKDFRLGLNAAQTTLGAVAELTGVTLK